MVESGKGGCKCFIKIWAWKFCDLHWIWLVLATLLAGASWLFIKRASLIYRILMLVVVIVLPILVAFYTCIWAGIVTALVELVFRVLFYLLPVPKANPPVEKNIPDEKK
jgi:hypothetical protein